MGLTLGNVIFDILEPPAFKKYSISYVIKLKSVLQCIFIYFISFIPILTAVIHYILHRQIPTPLPRTHPTSSTLLRK